jgi:hypothetical protein
MTEEIFNEILNSADGNYAFQAQILAGMKPTGW